MVDRIGIRIADKPFLFHDIKFLKLVYKPNSVSRRIETTAIYLSTTFQSGLSELPGNQTERAIPFPCLLLLRVGFAWLPPLQTGRCALTLIPTSVRPHLFTLIPPGRDGIFSVALSCIPTIRNDPGLRDTLPCGVRTFLPDKIGAAV